MSIKQFNATYLPSDDCILFRFNTSDDSEYRFWLTRRITLYILSLTTHLSVKGLEKKHPPDIAKAIVDFDNEVMQMNPTSRGVSRTQEYQPASKYPLGADAVLVLDVKGNLEKHGEEDRLLLDLILPGGTKINLKMAGVNLQAMCSLLNQLREYAVWGDIPRVSDNNSDSTEQKSKIEVSKISLH